MGTSSDSVHTVGTTERTKTTGGEVTGNYCGEHAVQTLMGLPSLSSPSIIQGNVVLKKGEQKIGYTAEEWLKLR